MSFARRAAFLALLSLPVAAAHADEGMWTFDAFPAAKMKADYGWAPDQAWLDKVRSAAVRLTGGCSASFVSGEGLILTNHHCVADCLAEPSTAEGRLPQERLHRRRAPKRNCAPASRPKSSPRSRDVTAQVKAAIGSATGVAAVKAQDRGHRQDRKRGLPRHARPALPGRHALRRRPVQALQLSQIFSDVRLVWAPEAQAPQFGGDPDNFNFPRYALDAAFLRAYEDGKPVATPQHLDLVRARRRSMARRRSSSAIPARPSGC